MSEFALVLALVAVMAVLALTSLGEESSGSIRTTGNALQTGTGGQTREGDSGSSSPGCG